MSVFQKAQLTLYGMERIAATHVGERLVFTSIGLGDVALTGDLHAVTELTGEKQRFPIYGSNVVGTNFWASCKPVGINDPNGIHVRSIGLYVADPADEDNRDSDRLYAVASIIPGFGDGPDYLAYIAQSPENAEINYEIRMNTVISPSALVKIVGGLGGIGIATTSTLGLVRSTNKKFGVSVDHDTGEQTVNDLEECLGDIGAVLDEINGEDVETEGTNG